MALVQMIHHTIAPSCANGMVSNCEGEADVNFNKSLDDEGGIYNHAIYGLEDAK